MGKRLAKKVLLIGWDAADWKVINKMIDEGKMPALKKLVEGGVMGNIATLDPPLSPTLWTSIATGKRPYKHGIHGFTEPDPSGKGVRPVLNTSRKVKALWNILTQHQMKSNVIGWWPSHPAEPINGVSISNFYQKANAPYGKPWKMMDGTVHPEAKSKLYEQFRVHPGELTPSHILPFVPKLQKVDESNEKRINSIAKIIADCSTIQAAATYCLEHEEYDLTAVYFDAIDHFCHGFMKFHPPRMEHIPEDLYDMYNGVVEGGYIYHDMMLERMMELIDDDTTVMLISDHGFHPDHLRPKALPKEPAAPALEHSPYGIIVMNGPGIKKDERIYGASILDITPTILTLFGLPHAKDMDGKVLSNAFEETPDIQLISSWEDIPGNCGMHPADQREDPYMAKEALDQLVELGYIEKPDENAEKAAQNTINENSYYLARSYIDGRQMDQAIEILERLHKENPDVRRYALRLANCYQQVNQVAKTREIIDKLNEGADKNNPSMMLMEGMLLLSEGKPAKAIEMFKACEDKVANHAKVHAQIGRGYSMVGKWVDAQRAYQKELEIDPENANAWHGLGLAFLNQEKFEEAIDALLNSIGLIYFMPFSHFHLAQALYGYGDYEKAAEAFEVTLKLAPNLNKARVWLNMIYKDHLDMPEKAIEVQEAIKTNSRGEITVVSGLPRSGTSMMMQMLERGGLDIFTDNVRQPDESNPRGYYEHEAIKGLKRDKRFVGEANGKAMKVISHLLEDLPQNYHYKVIFMERDINEVVKSQHKMLVRDGKAKSDVIPMNLITAFEKNLNQIKAWHGNANHVQVLFVDHKEVIAEPFIQAKRIAEFLGQSLDVEAMAGVVDKSLHREKAQA